MLYRDVDNKWKISKVPRRFNAIYTKSLVQYLNHLDLLFGKAKNTCEFEFILSLLNISDQ